MQSGTVSRQTNWEMDLDMNLLSGSVDAVVSAIWAPSDHGGGIVEKAWRSIYHGSQLVLTLLSTESGPATDHRMSERLRDPVLRPASVALTYQCDNFLDEE